MARLDTALDNAPADIAGRLLGSDRRVLLFGEPGSGKSTLAAGLARALGQGGHPCACIGADPGSPAFGVPGAVCRGEWRDGGWALLALDALCSLDAARFRLPLVSAVRRLAERAPRGALLVDAPGLVRGAAAAALLLGLAEAARIDLVLVLVRAGVPLPLPAELRALAAEVLMVRAAAEAGAADKRRRARERTRRWDAWLAEAEERVIALAEAQLVGMPPPLDCPPAWVGRQVALLEGARTVGLGELVALEGSTIRVRLLRASGGGSVLLVRDARRGADGLLGTARPMLPPALRHLPPPDVMPYPAPDDAGGPRPVIRAGPATAILVNGILGDPLLHLRLQQQKRSLLFDLGEAGRLPAGIAHQVSDVFISHAHADHIGGFLWLLRARIGDYPACRVYGPPGLAQNIAGLVGGIHWDRVGERGPRFEVAELHGERLVRFRVQAGRPGPIPLDARPAADGVLWDEPVFRVRAAVLDHAGTPVLAFAFEPAVQIAIRKERLLALGFAPGPWLTELKVRLAAGERAAPLRLPDGRLETAGALADDLALIRPGQTLVYATDLADLAENRRRLTALARGAYALFCEASFAETDAAQAARTGHLTARACGEIATAAGVARLVPFHFSRRYEAEPERIYAEVSAACASVVVPPGLVKAG